MERSSLRFLSTIFDIFFPGEALLGVLTLGRAGSALTGFSGLLVHPDTRDFSGRPLLGIAQLCAEDLLCCRS